MRTLPQVHVVHLVQIHAGVEVSAKGPCSVPVASLPAAPDWQFCACALQHVLGRPVAALPTKAHLGTHLQPCHDAVGSRRVNPRVMTAALRKVLVMSFQMCPTNHAADSETTRTSDRPVLRRQPSNMCRLTPRRLTNKRRHVTSSPEAHHQKGHAAFFPAQPLGDARLDIPDRVVCQLRSDSS
jgi:hypothetical protein